MRFRAATLLAASTCITTANAFTVGRSSLVATRRFGATLPRTSRFHALRMMTTSPTEFVKTEITSSDVTIFSKSYCPFCAATKSLFEELGTPNVKVIELDELSNGDQIQDALLDFSGQRTVPNVFVKGKHVGGNDATQAAAESGKLDELLAKQT